MKISIFILCFVACVAVAQDRYFVEIDKATGAEMSSYKTDVPKAVEGRIVMEITDKEYAADKLTSVANLEERKVAAATNSINAVDVALSRETCALLEALNKRLDKPITTDELKAAIKAEVTK